MNYISDVLFWISTGMLVPVIILLIFFFLRALLLLGGFFGQYLVKRKSGAEIREQMNTLTLDNIDTWAYRLPKNKQAVIVSYMKKLVDNRQSKAQVNRILDQYAQFVEGSFSSIYSSEDGSDARTDGYLNSDGSCSGWSFYR